MTSPDARSAYASTMAPENMGDRGMCMLGPYAPDDGCHPWESLPDLLELLPMDPGLSCEHAQPHELTRRASSCRDGVRSPIVGRSDESQQQTPSQTCAGTGATPLTA